MKRTTPLRRVRAKPRRTTSPRCVTRGCNKPQRVAQWCASHAEQVADRRFSRWVRDRDGRCTAAGMFDLECKGNLQAAHIIGRRRYASRFDDENVHSLCAAHHYLIDQHGSEHAKFRWAVSVLGASGFDALMERGATYMQRAQATEQELARKR